MPKPRKRKISEQSELFDIREGLRTAPCVPKLREAVNKWRGANYPGITDTTRRLFNHWFYSDHRLHGGGQFKYFPFQREAMETLVYLWEVEKARTFKDLIEKYAVIEPENLRLLQYDLFPRYCVKMATGTGKTKVMSLAVVWQFMNAMRGEGGAYAKTFLIIAPNVIVFDRLRDDFAGNKIFNGDPLIPRDFKVFWDFDCVMRGDSERGHAEGKLYLTNIHQLYEEDEDAAPSGEPEALAAILGPKPPANMAQASARDFAERIEKRGGPVMVLNDEAHHTHDEESEWSKVIREIVHPKTPLAMQLDFSATPRFQKGTLFPWTVYDYPIKQAIQDNVVKRPLRGEAKIREATSNVASTRYQGYLAAGVERWREYRDELAKLERKPVLFIMLNKNSEADEVGDWIRTKYPEDFGGEKTLVIHTDKEGDVSKKDLEEARKAAREVDRFDNPIRAIVSVMMLREGWDVQNVTVVVGLRPYSAKANILPEQAIGRGLRLMFRGQMSDGYRERVDIIGNRAFLEFVADLDRIEELEMETFNLGEDKLQIVKVFPVEDKAQYDMALPELSPSLVRRKSIEKIIEEIDVMALDCRPLPIREKDRVKEDSFTYEGYDAITDEKELEREYQVPVPQTPGEVIGFYARRVAEALKIPGHFSVFAPKVKEFFERKAFGKDVDLNAAGMLENMSTPLAYYVCVKVFKDALADKLMEEKTPSLVSEGRKLSQAPPMPWSNLVYEARKSVFNLVPCANEYERTFAKFLDDAEDVARFAKLDDTGIGFAIDYLDSISNSRLYYPDFIAQDTKGQNWILETKGRVDKDDLKKAEAARLWCENATALTKTNWQYVLVEQREFEKMRPELLADLLSLPQ